MVGDGMSSLARLFTTMCLCSLALTPARAGELVEIGITAVQPPFSFHKDRQQGLVFDVIKALNSYQDKYTFEASIYPTKRILKSPKQLDLHIIAFNDENWGWSQRNAKGSLTLTNGKDVFIARKDNKLRSTTAAVSGYHYAFADYDPIKLETMPGVTAVQNEELVLDMVLRNRADRGVISLTFLQWVKVSDPQAYAKIEVVDQPDHTYNRQFIMLSWSPIATHEMNELLLNMKKDGIWDKVFGKYGLPAPPLEAHP